MAPMVAGRAELSSERSYLNRLRAIVAIVTSYEQTSDASSHRRRAWLSVVCSYTKAVLGGRMDFQVVPKNTMRSFRLLEDIAAS
jgi:hypothetical protein